MTANNPQVQVGDIWKWIGKTYVLVLGYNDEEAFWICLNLNSGGISDWSMNVNNVSGDWEHLA